MQSTSFILKFVISWLIIWNGAIDLLIIFPIWTKPKFFWLKKSFKWAVTFMECEGLWHFSGFGITFKLPQGEFYVKLKEGRGDLLLVLHFPSIQLEMNKKYQYSFSMQGSGGCSYQAHTVGNSNMALYKPKTRVCNADKCPALQS